MLLREGDQPPCFPVFGLIVGLSMEGLSLPSSRLIGASIFRTFDRCSSVSWSMKVVKKTLATLKKVSRYAVAVIDSRVK